MRHQRDALARHLTQHQASREPDAAALFEYANATVTGGEDGNAETLTLSFTPCCPEAERLSHAMHQYHESDMLRPALNLWRGRPPAPLTPKLHTFLDKHVPDICVGLADILLQRKGPVRKTLRQRATSHASMLPC